MNDTSRRDTSLIALWFAMWLVIFAAPGSVTDFLGDVFGPVSSWSPIVVIACVTFPQVLLGFLLGRLRVMLVPLLAAPPLFALGWVRDFQEGHATSAWPSATDALFQFAVLALPAAAAVGLGVALHYATVSRRRRRFEHRDADSRQLEMS